MTKLKSEDGKCRIPAKIYTDPTEVSGWRRCLTPLTIPQYFLHFWLHLVHFCPLLLFFFLQVLKNYQQTSTLYGTICTLRASSWIKMLKFSPLCNASFSMATTPRLQCRHVSSAASQPKNVLLASHKKWLDSADRRLTRAYFVPKGKFACHGV